MKKILFAAFLIPLLAIPVMGAGAITWNWSGIQTSWSATYDPYWEGAGYTNGDTVTITVSSAGAGAHPYFMTRTTSDTFLRLQRSTGGSTYVIPYSLYKNNNPPLQELKIPSLATIDNVISGSFTGNSGSASHIYYIIPDEAVTVPAGLYTASNNLTLALYGKAFTTNPGTASRTTSISKGNIQLTVPSYGAISIMPSSFSYTQGSNIWGSVPFGPSVIFPYATTTQALDFGSTGENTFITGATQGCKILVACNTTWGLTIRSANGGKLKQAGSTDEVPYTVNFDGTAANVSVAGVATSVLSGRSWTNGGYDSYDVDVEIGTVESWLDAGTYTDTLTFTLSYP